MGDRSNIFFRSGSSGIGVYAHWSGLEMASAAAKVVASKAFKSRLGDPTYALRIGVQTVLERLESDASSDTGGRANRKADSRKHPKGHGKRRMNAPPELSRSHSAGGRGLRSVKP